MRLFFLTERNKHR